MVCPLPADPARFPGQPNPRPLAGFSAGREIARLRSPIQRAICSHNGGLLVAFGDLARHLLTMPFPLLHRGVCLRWLTSHHVQPELCGEQAGSARRHPIRISASFQSAWDSPWRSAFPHQPPFSLVLLHITVPQNRVYRLSGRHQPRWRRKCSCSDPRHAGRVATSRGLHFRTTTPGPSGVAVTASLKAPC